MSDLLDDLEREVSTWPAPAKDLPGVVRRGRRLSWTRRGIGAALCLALIAAGALGYRAWDEAQSSIRPAGASFELIEEAAALNGVQLERTDADGSWIAPPGEDWPELMEAPVPVLVTASGLGGGLEDKRAWASVVDGYRPGPVLRNDGSSGLSRIFVTLTFMDRSMAFLPFAPPYEDFGRVRVPEADGRPSDFWVDFSWEGIELEHPSDWRRSDPIFELTSETERETLLLSNVGAVPERRKCAPRCPSISNSDLSPAAVFIEISRLGGLSTREPLGSVPDTVDFGGDIVGRRLLGGHIVWFWIGRDASEAEREAVDRVLLSINERVSEGPTPEEVFEELSRLASLGDGIPEIGVRTPPMPDVEGLVGIVSAGVPDAAGGPSSPVALRVWESPPQATEHHLKMISDLIRGAGPDVETFDVNVRGVDTSCRTDASGTTCFFVWGVVSGEVFDRAPGHPDAERIVRGVLLELERIGV